MKTQTYFHIVICFLLLTANIFGFAPFSGIRCFSQNMAGHSVNDSLLSLLQNEKEDTGKINRLNELCAKYQNLDSYDTAIDYGYQALRLAQQLKFKNGMGQAYTNLGNTYNAKCNYIKALENHLAAWKINEEMGDKTGISASYNNLGNVYYKQGNFDRALENYLASLKIDLEIKNKEESASTYINIGNIYKERGDYGKALENYFAAMKTGKETGNKLNLAISYINIGNVYEAQGNYDKALENYFAGQKITDASENKLCIAASLNNIGIIYKKKENYRQAIGYLQNAINLSSAIGVLDLMMEGYRELSDVYEKMNDWENAYEYHRLYSQIKDSIFNTESDKKIVEMQTKYETEKKDKEITLLSKDREIQNVRINRQQILIWSVVAGLALMFAFTAFVVFSYRQKQKANILLEDKNKIIEKQRNDMLSSMNYASRIQQSILLPEEEIKKYLPGFFVFLHPRDIVCGDFYWFSKHENKFTIAAVDCTGHGVPGALMSMLGITIMDRIINDRQILRPADILYHLHSGINHSLQQSKYESYSQDGMDIALCTIDTEKKIIEYAGAGNPLYAAENGKINVIKGNPLSIGGRKLASMQSDERIYTNHELPLTNDMTIYLFSDGYIDQPGGIDRRKLGSSRFRDILVKNYKKNPEEQKTELANEIKNWQGIHKQIDDMLVVGLKF